jgi:hypothetical protein
MVQSFPVSRWAWIIDRARFGRLFPGVLSAPISGPNRKQMALQQPRKSVVYVKEIHSGRKVPWKKISFEPLTAETY